MSDAHLQDAYHQVTVPLPNGQTVTGKPIMYQDAMRLLALNDAFTSGGRPKDTIEPMLRDFFKLTGIDAKAMADLGLAEVLDVVSRFFWARRPAPTAGLSVTSTVTAPAGGPPPAA